MHIQFVWEIFQKILQLITLKKAEFYGYVYHFSVGYDVIDICDITDIHKHLIKKHYNV